MQAYKDKIIVKVEESPEFIGSIVLPESSREVPNKGTVVSIGTEIIKTHGLKDGYVILFGKYSGMDIEVEGQRYKILKEDDVLATL